MRRYSVPMRGAPPRRIVRDEYVDYPIQRAYVSPVRQRMYAPPPEIFYDDFDFAPPPPIRDYGYAAPPVRAPVRRIRAAPIRYAREPPPVAYDPLYDFSDLDYPLFDDLDYAPPPPPSRLPRYGGPIQQRPIVIRDDQSVFQPTVTTAPAQYAQVASSQYQQVVAPQVVAPQVVQQPIQVQQSFQQPLSWPQQPALTTTVAAAPQQYAPPQQFAAPPQQFAAPQQYAAPASPSAGQPGLSTSLVLDGLQVQPGQLIPQAGFDLQAAFRQQYPDMFNHDGSVKVAQQVNNLGTPPAFAAQVAQITGNAQLGQSAAAPYQAQTAFQPAAFSQPMQTGVPATSQTPQPGAK